PIQILYRNLRKDSGGTGRHKGGDGLDFAFRFVGDTPATCSLLSTRFRIPAPGLKGGAAGEVAVLKVNGNHVDPSNHLTLHPGDLVSIKTAGGGGFGQA